MELKQLRAFLAVAEALSFTRAAQRLNLTQPPLTRQIAALEHKLGVSLFARTSRRVALTAAGNMLLAHVRPLLLHADQVAQVMHHQRLECRHFGVGCTPMAYYSAMPLLIAQFRQQYPQIQLSVREASTDAQLDALSQAQLDVAFILMPAQRAGLEIRPIWRQCMALSGDASVIELAVAWREHDTSVHLNVFKALQGLQAQA
jgi:DNA-binding transcriptional LysR family regulator